MEAIWIALQESAFAGMVRNSVLLYPVANITHVVAVIAFFGVVATMDLRILGTTGGQPPRTVIARLRPVALVLLLLIAITGFTLFSAEAVVLARNPAFQLKLAAIGLALLNIAVNEWAFRNRRERTSLTGATAGASLLAWLLVAALGRSIAYV
jgi:hypothetical protein